MPSWCDKARQRIEPYLKTSTFVTTRPSGRIACILAMPCVTCDQSAQNETRTYLMSGKVHPLSYSGLCPAKSPDE